MVRADAAGCVASLAPVRSSTESHLLGCLVGAQIPVIYRTQKVKGANPFSRSLGSGCTILRGL